MVRDEDLDFWIQHQCNVLFVGHAGVGKTSMIEAAFNRNNLKWKYFSASTMDPWVDLVGVPKEKIDENGNSYLDLIRPKEFQFDQVEAIFFDEFNRSHKKVRNACMELIQFKSINGKKFNNLKLVWAAINPDDDENYDVEKLDPAQKDRFHIYVEIPYKPVKSYFTNKFGENNGKAAISWWDGLSVETKMKVSPRRLSYALDILSKGGDIRYVLPESSNVAKLLTTLKHGPIAETLQKMFDKKEVDIAKTFLAIENNYAASIEWILKKKERIEFFFTTLPPEKISLLLSSNDIVLEIALNHVASNPQIKEIISKIMLVGSNSKILGKVKKAAKLNPSLSEDLGLTKPLQPVNLGIRPVASYNGVGSNAMYSTLLEGWLGWFKKNSFHGTQERKKIYKEMLNNIPVNMTLVESLKTMQLLNDYARHSQVTTIVKLPNFIGMINNCIKQISLHNNDMAWDGIIKKYKKSHFQHLFTKFLRHAPLGEQIYCPGKVIPQKV